MPLSEIANPENLKTLSAAGAAIVLGKDAVQRLLGPTADLLGEGLRNLAQKRYENIGKIFQNAESKLGDRVEKPGMVPPKVLKMVLDEGSFSDEALIVEYLGGILASSRTELGRDDRGARMAKTIDSLSTYQLRSHYLIYSTIRTLFAGKGLSMNLAGRPKMQFFMPFSGYGAAMDFSPTENEQMESIYPHIFFGLSRDDLIENHWKYGDKDSLKDIFAGAVNAGIVCQPTALGAEVFLWAFGHADKPLDYIFSPEFNPVVAEMPDFVPGAFATKA